jgi:hypothetical protein
MPKIKLFKLKEIFAEVKMGDFHASNELDLGKVPLVSCSAEDNGIEGYFDLPKEKLYNNCITIASDGAPLTAFYHDYTFGAKDNVIICVPKPDTKIETIYYALFQINKQQWRFSYGRKFYYNKINVLDFPFPVTEKGEIDEEYLEKCYNTDISKKMPRRNNTDQVKIANVKFKEFEVGKLFEIVSGDFHAISELDEGKVPLISCGDKNNGFVGFYDIPEQNTYKNTLTIAYNGAPLTTKFHAYKFGTKDDVAICNNINNYKITTILFIASTINKLAWRFSYGRKCYREKVKAQKILLPINSANQLDEDLMEDIVKNTPYFNSLKTMLN